MFFTDHKIRTTCFSFESFPIADLIEFGIFLSTDYADFRRLNTLIKSFDKIRAADRIEFRIFPTSRCAREHGVHREGILLLSNRIGRMGR
jgi:hypothetical protein